MEANEGWTGCAPPPSLASTAVARGTAGASAPPPSRRTWPKPAPTGESARGPRAVVGALVETAVATEVDVVAMEVDVVDMVVDVAAAMVALVVALAEAKAVATVAANMVAPPLIFSAIDHIVAKNDP